MSFALLLLPRLAAPAAGQDLKPVIRDFLNPIGGGTAGSAIATITSLEVSTAPLGTSTGGFTFAFDPTLRIWARTSNSYGPAFTERSLPTGRSKVSFGVNFLHSNYSSFAGQDLDNTDFRPAKNIKGFGTASYTAVQMNLSSDTLVAFGHVGLTDDLDVGLALPWIRVSTDGTGAFFDAANNNISAAELGSMSQSGIGDIAVYGKYRFWKTQTSGAAAAVELRLPTGDDQALRGLGVTRVLMTGIWSRAGKISPHVNVGYEIWSDNVPIRADGSVAAKNQVKFGGGVEIEAHPRMTIVLDVIGRNLLKGGQVEYQTFAGATPGSSVDALVAIAKGVHSVSFAPSVKWNMWNAVLLNGNVLVSLSNNGLRSAITPVVGLDWAF